MILIEKKDYHKLIEPLQKVAINKLFVRSVIEQHVSGKVYVDNLRQPGTFHVVHPYGMSLLFGDHTNTEFNEQFQNHALNRNKNRNRHEWMQAYPDSWDAVLTDLFKDHLIRSAHNTEKKEDGIIELNTRVNFSFNHQKYAAFKQQNHNTDFTIIRTDKQTFEEMKGSVVPSAFWDSADDFIGKGVGFSLFYDNKLAATAYSAFIHDNQLELGIETLEAFRGKGLAQYVCAALIDYCILHNYEPVWSCRIENTGSFNLAQKLGFEPIREIPFYRMSQ